MLTSTALNLLVLPTLALRWAFAESETNEIFHSRNADALQRRGVEHTSTPGQ
jgi:hypothetical protein